MILKKQILLVVQLVISSTEISFPKDNSLLIGRKIRGIEVVPDSQADYSPAKLLNSTDAQLKTVTVTLSVKGTEEIKQIPAHTLMAKNYNGNIKEMDGQVIDWDKSKIQLHTVLANLNAGAVILFNVYYE
jgi:hypothetical protein